MYRVPGMCVFEARSLMALHPLGTKHQASCSLIHPRSYVSSAQSGGYSQVITRMPFSALEVREHLGLIALYGPGECFCLSCVGLREHPRLSLVRVFTRARGWPLGEGAPETLMMYTPDGSKMFFFPYGKNLRDVISGPCCLFGFLRRSSGIVMSLFDGCQ